MTDRLHARAAAAAIAFMALSAAAQETPTLTEPALQKKMEVSRAELARWRGSPDAYFQMPASGVAVPCAAAETGIKASVGIVDWANDPEMKRAMAKANRSSGMVKGAMAPPAFNVSKFIVVKAQCEGEVAMGDYEAWVDYAMVNDTAQFTSTSPFLVHVTGRFEKGEARPVEAMVARRVGASANTWKDPATAQMMAKVAPTKIVLAQFQTTDKQGSVTVTSTTVNGKEAMTSMVSTVQRGAEMRTLTRMYSDATLTNESRTKDGAQHGAQVSYPYFNKQFNVQIPGGTLCFDEGEQIKTTNCDIQ